MRLQRSIAIAERFSTYYNATGSRTRTWRMLTQALRNKRYNSRMSDLTLRFAFTIRANLAQAVTIGTMPRGLRRYVPIVGGTVEGPSASGQVLPGGGDSQISVAPTLLEVDARYLLLMDDGTLVGVHNHGVRRAAADVMGRLMAGDAVAASEYYFRTAPHFEAPVDSAYAWLNTSLFVATAEREKTVAIIHVHEVC